MPEHAIAHVGAHIAALLPTLLPAEQAVARVFLERGDEAVELSSQGVADLAGTSRATVVRACQSLGFAGYQQLRVALARESGRVESPVAVEGADAVVRAHFRRIAAAADTMTALLEPDAVAAAVDAISAAERVLVVGNGLSASLAHDCAARLSGIGRLAECVDEPMGQRVTARLLGAGSVVIAVSGSGIDKLTLAAAATARAGGASVVALTSFPRSPLAQLADITLTVGQPHAAVADELHVASRIPHAIAVEGLVAAVAERRGESARMARRAALDALSEQLDE